MQALAGKRFALILAPATIAECEIAHNPFDMRLVDNATPPADGIGGTARPDGTVARHDGTADSELVKQ